MGDTVQLWRRKDTGAEVEAVQLTKENVKEVADWCTGQEVTEIDSLDNTKSYVALNFISWDGMARASEGDYIILDPMGNFLSRWGHAFEEAFEKVDNDG